jgi:hypothetical protein
MANSQTIPQEIIDLVIAAIGDDKPSLKQCALVSSQFLPPSRRQLLSEITIRGRRSSEGILLFLSSNAVFPSLVKSLALRGSIGAWLHRRTLLDILRLQFCCLESFAIDAWDRQGWNWNNFSSELRDAFSDIIHSDTLKHLFLGKVVNVPISLLDTVHLTRLDLYSLSPNDFVGEQSSSLTPAASEGVTGTASHTVIDQCGWYFRDAVNGTRFSMSTYFLLIWDNEGFTEPIFLPFMCRLRYVEITIDPYSANLLDFNALSIMIRSLRVSLTSPPTLEHIYLHISFYASDNPSNYNGFYQQLRYADFWSHLDSITTHPTGLRLQRVDIDIDYTPREEGIDAVFRDKAAEPDKDKILEAVFHGLPLLRKEGILFVEATVGE